MAFNDFQRGYPYIKEAISNVLIVEFENGFEQRRDKWGKTKQLFEINFNVNTKSEILAIKDFFENTIGPAISFPFTCPVDGKSYTVRFVDGSFRYERRFYNTYFGACKLIEVFS